MYNAKGVFATPKTSPFQIDNSVFVDLCVSLYIERRGGAHFLHNSNIYLSKMEQTRIEIRINSKPILIINGFWCRLFGGRNLATSLNRHSGLFVLRVIPGIECPFGLEIMD
jgi:hypothetical protein